MREGELKTVSFFLFFLFFLVFICFVFCLFLPLCFLEGGGEELSIPNVLGRLTVRVVGVGVGKGVEPRTPPPPYIYIYISNTGV